MAGKSEASREIFSPIESKQDVHLPRSMQSDEPQQQRSNGHGNVASTTNGDNGVMDAPELKTEPGFGASQPGPKPSLLGSKRSHSSGNRSDDSESGTEQSHHDQRQRRRGNPWSEDEHRSFLAGLKKLGKGDWRGISRHFVQTRTPTQVASHAQKYFIRQLNLHNRKRRSSLFDMAPEPETAPSSGPAQEAALHGFQQSRQGDLFGGGMQAGRVGGPPEIQRLEGGSGVEDERLGYQQWLQGQMPVPAAHPAVVQAMLQAAAVGGQCMPPMAAMYMAAAFSGRPPGLPPPLQQGGFPMPPPFGFGSLGGMPGPGGPGALTPQQLAGMSVLLQQQAAAAAMFPGAFNPLDPSGIAAAAMQSQFANAVAANQMLAMGGPMGGQPGMQPGAQLPPPGGLFGGAALFRPPSGGNLAAFGGGGVPPSGQQQQQQLPPPLQQQQQQPLQMDDGERSFGRRRDTGSGSGSGREQGHATGLASRERSGYITDGGSNPGAGRVHRPQPSHARPAYPGAFLREGPFARGGPGDKGGGGGGLAHDNAASRGCPLGSGDRLGSGGRLSSFRQLAQSPKGSGLEEQGETTGGTTGASGGRSGDMGPPKDGRSSSCTTTNRDRQGQQVKAESCALSAERRFTPGGSLQSSLQDTQDNSLGTSTQFGASQGHIQDPPGHMLSPR